MSDEMRVAGALHRANAETGFFRTEADYALEFGEYLAKAAEAFMAEQNRAWEAEEIPDPDAWRALQSAIGEFRKRAASAKREREADRRHA